MLRHVNDNYYSELAKSLVGSSCLYNYINEVYAMEDDRLIRVVRKHDE